MLALVVVCASESRGQSVVDVANTLYFLRATEPLRPAGPQAAMDGIEFPFLVASPERGELNAQLSAAADMSLPPHRGC